MKRGPNMFVVFVCMCARLNGQSVSLDGLLLVLRSSSLFRFFRKQRCEGVVAISRLVSCERRMSLPIFRLLRRPKVPKLSRCFQDLYVVVVITVTDFPCESAKCCDGMNK